MTPPGGTEVRLATVDDAEAIARVHVASWQSAYRDILPPELLSALSVARRTEGWRRNVGSQPFVEVAYGWSEPG